MASQNPPRSSDDMILFALEQALREVWAVLKAHDPHGYLDKMTVCRRPSRTS